MRFISWQSIAFVILSTMVVTATGCGGSNSTPVHATITPTATNALTSTATPTEVPTVTATALLPTPTPSDPIAGLPVDETIHLPGLGGQTDAVTDELGIPHIYGPDLDSIVFVQGYLVAASRFWSMDAFRRVAEGRLSEIFGAITLSTDVVMRTEFTTRDGRRLEEALWEHVQAVDPEIAQLLNAYAAGINAWLADLRAGRNGATLPPDYEMFLVNQTANDLQDWRPQDTIAIARLQAWSLSETLEDEIDRASLDANPNLPAALRADVFRSAPAAPATVLPVGQSAQRSNARARSAPAPVVLPPMRILRAVSDLLAHAAAAWPFGSRHTSVGSNNWIVAPALSANGFAMVANDPHLQLFNPPIWFMQQLEATTGPRGPERVNGVNFPGLPGVILGHNDKGAWGATVSGFDVTDVYVETVTTPPDYPSSPRTVLFKGDQVPVLRIDEHFKMKGGADRIFPIEVVPHHGPMVPDPDLTDGVEGLAATDMSFRWTGHEITNDERFLLDLNRAGDVDEFKAAIRSFAVGGQNWVWGDVHGDIAYFPYVLVPQRPAGTVPFRPMSGTGDAEWLTDGQGNTLWLPEDKIPQATNPPQGFLSTANNDQVGNTLDNDPLNDATYFAYSFDLGFREQRIQEMLSNSAGDRASGSLISAADMSRYQYDTSSKEAARLVPFLLTAAENRPDLVTADMQAALDRLRSWGARTNETPPYRMVSGIDPADLRSDVPPRQTPVSDRERADAIASSIFAGWTTRLVPEIFADDFADTGVGVPGGQDATKALLHILEDTDRTEPGLIVHTKGADGQSTLWDNRNTPQVETRDEILLGALQDGLSFLANSFATADQTSWLWGKIHQVRLQHFFGQAGIPFFDLGPFAAGGGRFTVDPANYSLTGSSFTYSDGPSQRFVAVLDPAGVRAVNALPGGQNGNPGGKAAQNFNRINPSVHYGDLMPGWINGETFEYHISHAEVAAHAVRKVRFAP
ncbi:MAG TPA: penicillin acylase family protein [Candidatus Binatia bacterium]|nr:penicillin acylase family protein [Candidatus Binatia bacterium]